MPTQRLLLHVCPRSRTAPGWRRPGVAPLLSAGLCLVLLCASSGSVRAQSQIPAQFIDQLIVQGLNEPTGLAFLPDQRLLIIERTGAVRLIAEGKLGAVDPMFVCDNVDPSGDRGATGIAIDPRWPDSPYIYVYYDAADQTCKIVRYTVGGDVAISSSLYLTVDPATRYDIINDIPDLFDVHNGGSLRFGPDNMLYAALGEDANGCAAQDTTSLRGVVLRMDIRGLPDGPGGPPDRDLIVAVGNPLASYPVKNARLVWATGLRNPFRFHFDPLTGVMYLGDVGFTLFEEVDRLEGPMPNFGWPYLEGPAPFTPDCAGFTPSGGLTPPIYAYDRTGFTASVIGGGVYRRTNCSTCSFPPEYEGDYFFSDFYEGFLRRLKFDGLKWSVAPAVAGQPSGQDWGRGFEEVADYLEGADGAIWYVKMGYNFELGTGEVRRLYFNAPLVGVSDASTAGIKLAAPYPMPSRGAVNLRYELPRTARVDLEVLDLQGRQVRALIGGAIESPGVHHGGWDGSGPDGRPVAQGVYMALLRVDGVSLTQLIVMIR